MIRIYILISLFFVTGLKAQYFQGPEICKGAMVAMQPQPLDSGTSGKFSKLPYDGLYTARWYFTDKSGIIEWHIVVQHFDGEQWNMLQELVYPRPKGQLNNINLLTYKGRLFISGSFRSVNGNAAPHGKAFELAEYKNGNWDTVRGCTMDTATKPGFESISEIVTNENGIYRFTKDANNNIAGYKLNETGGKWTQLLNAHYFQGMELLVSTGKYRIALSTLDSLNGKPTKGIVWIDKMDKVHAMPATVNIPDRTPVQVGIDKVTDLIYFTTFSYYYKGLSSLIQPYITVFDTAVIQQRLTKIISPGSSSWLGDNSLEVYNGNLAFSRVDMDPARKHHQFVLCRSGELWQDITNAPLMRGNIYLADFNTIYHLFATKFGFYGSKPCDERIHKFESASTLEGKFIVDSDENCVWDSLKDDVMHDGEIMIEEISGKSQYYGYSDKNGFYSIIAPPGDYEYKARNKKYKYVSCFSNALTISGADVTKKDILVQKPAKTDLSLSYAGRFTQRWNSEYKGAFMIANFGRPCDSVEFIIDLPNNVSVLNNGNWHYDSATHKAKGVFSKFETGESVFVSLSFIIDWKGIANGSTICFSAHVHSLCDEMDSTDNAIKFCIKIVYSYDPNHIEVDKETVHPGQASWLNYFVEFQNSGNDYAEDVVLVDTLPDNVDPETLKFTASGNKYTAEVNERILVIKFPGIHLLAQKVNEEKSKGYISYSVQTIAAVKQNDLIKNKVSIYFDLNPAIATKYATTLVSEWPAAVQKYNNNANAILFFPNPSKKEFNVRNISGSEQSILIFNSSGQLLYSKTLAENAEDTWDLSAWGPGIYILRSTSGVYKLVVF